MNQICDHISSYHFPAVTLSFSESLRKRDKMAQGVAASKAAPALEAAASGAPEAACPGTQVRITGTQDSPFGHV